MNKNYSEEFRSPWDTTEELDEDKRDYLQEKQREYTDDSISRIAGCPECGKGYCSCFVDCW